jgi:hypothetical protein
MEGYLVEGGVNFLLFFPVSLFDSFYLGFKIFFYESTIRRRFYVRRAQVSSHVEEGVPRRFCQADGGRQILAQDPDLSLYVALCKHNRHTCTKCGLVDTCVSMGTARDFTVLTSRGRLAVI